MIYTKKTYCQKIMQFLELAELNLLIQNTEITLQKACKRIVLLLKMNLMVFYNIVIMLFLNFKKLMAFLHLCNVLPNLTISTKHRGILSITYPLPHNCINL